MGPYSDWRLAVEHLAGTIRFKRLLAYGYVYNYRLWIRGPLLRIVGEVDTTRHVPNTRTGH